jgi:hypothetical protein
MSAGRLMTNAGWSLVAKKIELGSRTRRRPIKRDYVAARCGLRPIGAYAYAPVGRGKEVQNIELKAEVRSGEFSFSD